MTHRIEVGQRRQVYNRNPNDNGMPDIWCVTITDEFINGLGLVLRGGNDINDNPNLNNDLVIGDICNNPELNEFPIEEQIRYGFILEPEDDRMDEGQDGGRMRRRKSKGKSKCKCKCKSKSKCKCKCKSKKTVKTRKCHRRRTRS